MKPSMSLKKSKAKSNLPPSVVTANTKSEKTPYCDTCPACKTLKRISFSFTSAKNTADIIKGAGLDVDTHMACVTGFLQKHYGNSFTQQTMENVEKSKTPEPGTDKNIHRAHAAVNIKEDPNELKEQEGRGRPLDFSTRLFMESKMGHSFKDVKVHTDSYADKSAKNLNAHAYTKGRDIFFASGKFKPETSEGRKLIAHELTHVAQSKGSSQKPLNKYQNYSVSYPHDASERYANSVAESVISGASVRVQPDLVQSSSKTIYRKSKDDDSGYILRKVADYAANFPGFTLLTVILGKNPITGQEVKRNAKTIFEGLLGLIPGGAALFKKLNQSGAIDRAFEWVSKEIKAMNITWKSIKALFKKAWDSFSWWDLFRHFGRTITRIKNIFVPTFNKIKNFVLSLGKKILTFIFEGALQLIGAPVKKFMGILKKAGDVISLIVSDPIQFLKNLLSALGKGFKQFSANIWNHLKTGIMGWLFGTLSKAGIKMPKTFTLTSIFKLVLDILGINKKFLKGKVERVIGKKNMALFEKAWSFISTLISSGVSGLWNMMKEYLGNLKDIVIGAIKNWVVTKIIKSATVKLVSMFNPVGAIITAIQTIYNTIMFFIERFKQIMELVNSIVESISSIAKGVIGKAANWIEKTMARTIPVIISFLARLIGLGGISEKIKSIIKKLRKKVSDAVDKVIDKIVIKARGLLEKVLPGKKEKGQPDKKKEEKLSPEVQKRWDAGMADIAELKKRSEKKLTYEDEIKTSLAKIKEKHKFKSLKYKFEGDECIVDAQMNPGSKISIQKIQKIDGDEGDVHFYGYINLKKDSNQDRHHVPAKNLINEVKKAVKTKTSPVFDKLKTWNQNRGVAIVMDKKLHQGTRTYGSGAEKEVVNKVVGYLNRNSSPKSDHRNATKAIRDEVIADKNDVSNIYFKSKAHKSIKKKVSKNVKQLVTLNDDHYLN